MAKTSATNATASGAWQYGNAAGDAFAKEDVQNLGANFDAHDHSSTKALAVSRLATSVTLTASTTFTGFGVVIATGGLTVTGTTVVNGTLSSGGFDAFLGTGGIGNSATTGFCYIASGGGSPSGTPSATGTNLVPMRFDTSLNKLWIYTGGTWKGVVVA